MKWTRRCFQKQNIPLLAGSAVMLVFVLWSLFPALFAPHDPKEMFAAWARPSLTHLLGTNDMGYDIFSELIHAASSTLLTGLSAALIALAAGLAAGALAGYLSGWKGELVNTVIDVFLLIPMLPMTIVLAAFLGPGTGNIVLTISLLSWCSTAKAVRAKALQLRQSAFVESLLVLGIPKPRILLRHIVPNLSEVVLAKYIMSVADCMLMEATVSFIGLGDPTRVTWGGMISLAFQRGGFSRGAVNWYLAPGLCIALCVLAFYFINLHFERKASSTGGSGAQSYLD